MGYSETREGYGVLYDINKNEIYNGTWHKNNYHGQGRLHNLVPEYPNQEFNIKQLDQIDNYWDFYEGEFEDG